MAKLVSYLDPLHTTIGTEEALLGLVTGNWEPEFRDLLQTLGPFMLADWMFDEEWGISVPNAYSWGHYDVYNLPLPLRGRYKWWANWLV